MPSLSQSFAIMAFVAGSVVLGQAAVTPEQASKLPPAADHTINFAKEIKPIFESSCIKCHGRGRAKGGFRLDTRETLLQGSDSGAVIVQGKSSESMLIALVAGVDPDNVMPKKGTRLTAQQIGLLRGWIDQGAAWDAGITFARPEPANLKRHSPQLPAAGGAANPIDQLLERYFVEHKIAAGKSVADRLFVRRAYLDIIGLPPSPDELNLFLVDRRKDKRDRLVEQLLGRSRDYAEHWLSFWNDMLRNDYKGTGYIDGGRQQITRWLYSALLTNMPYDRFVAQLIEPVPGSEGFTKGIVWRGVVNASQTPQMQAAQNICQVFMGVNLKCASCHDSFINDLTLTDSYGLAGVYAEKPLEMVQCDKPTGQTAPVKFIYPELGNIDPSADRPARLKQLAELVTGPKDGRLARTLVNRVWQRLLGRGLVEPVDDMEKPAWNQDLLDWLAEDFAASGYDMKHLLKRIITSRAYQMPAVNLGEQSAGAYVFRGPAVRRLSAEQFRDALTEVTTIGYASPVAEVTPSESEQKRFAPPVPVKWIWNEAHAAEKAPPGHVYFRKTVELTAAPEEGTAFVICDNSFTLFVNGRKVGSGNDFKNGYVFDLRPFLKAGVNLFAIDAVNHLADGSPPPAEAAPAAQENPAGLLFYARLRHIEKGATSTNDFGSDTTWDFSTQKQAGWETEKFEARDWAPAVRLGEMGMPPWRVSKEYLVEKIAAAYPGKVRASLVAADALTTALGRPNRDQVVTTRQTAATTLQALEMTNGETLADILQRGAEKLLDDGGGESAKVINALYLRALSRPPTAGEVALARNLIGQPARKEGVEDLLWATAMLPEFQLIY